jgi:hypothetical protein
MRAILGVVPIACLLAGGAAWSTTPKIGTTAVAEKDVSGTLGKERRSLKRGDGVFQNELIATGQGASAQVLFNDETALTIGPNAQVILDSFVYDPNKRSGAMTIRAMTGAFRFVSGSAPKGSYTIETPVASVGIRGSIIHIVIQGRWLWVSVTEGSAIVCIGANSCVTLDKPGTYAVTNGAQTSPPQSKNDSACGSSGSGSFSTSGGRSYCTVFDDSGQTLYLYFLGIGQLLNDLTPAAGPRALPPGNPPPPPPGNNPPPPPGNGPPPPPVGGPPPPPPPPGPPPPPPPPTGTSFSPMVNPGVGEPPGLKNKLPDSLPPGLQDRCGSGTCAAPGGANKTPPGQVNTPPGQAKKP